MKDNFFTVCWFLSKSTWIRHGCTYVPSLFKLPSTSLPIPPFWIVTEPCLSSPNHTANSHVTVSIHLTLSFPCPWPKVCPKLSALKQTSIIALSLWVRNSGVAKLEPLCPLWPSLGGHTPSPPKHPMVYMRQPTSWWEGATESVSAVNPEYPGTSPPSPFQNLQMLKSRT